MLGSLGQADLPAMADLAHGLFDEVELEAKEALALLNSNAFSTGMATLAVADTDRLLDAIDVAGALDLEAFAANLTMLHPGIGEVRPYPGLARVARPPARAAGRQLSLGGGAARNLQDPLTFRGLPQLHGALRDALAFVARPARDRAQRLAGEPADRPGRGSHRLGRELRDPAARRGARLPPHRARTGSDDRRPSAS